MKQRIITAIVGLMVLGVFFVFYNTIIADIMIAIFASIAVFELLKAMKLTKYKLFSISTLIYTYCVIFSTIYFPKNVFLIVTLIYITFCFVYMLNKLETFPIEKMFYGLAVSFFIGIIFSIFVIIKYKSNAQNALFYLLIGLGSAWWSDAGAYFTGTLCGKHKLCPHVSPKKTIEGLIGGIVVSILGNLAVSYTFITVCNNFAPFSYILNNGIKVDVLRIVLLTPFLSLMGVLGDLSASIIKRQTNIKDYGNLFPGHGGVMDRFDSVLFIMPYIYVIFNMLPFIH